MQHVDDDQGFDEAQHVDDGQGIDAINQGINAVNYANAYAAEHGADESSDESHYSDATMADATLVNVMVVPVASKTQVLVLDMNGLLLRRYKIS